MPANNRMLDTIADDGYIAPTRVRSLSTQKRLRETVEILNRVSDWCGGPVQALAWFRSQPLPSFGDLTAEDLLKAGRADALRVYLRRVAEGGYA